MYQVYVISTRTLNAQHDVHNSNHVANYGVVLVKVAMPAVGK